MKKRCRIYQDKIPAVIWAIRLTFSKRPAAGLGGGRTVLNVFGRNDQFRKVFWAVFIALAGLVLAQVVDPATAQEILRLLAGTG